MFVPFSSTLKYSLPSEPKLPSNLGWKSKLFAQDVADTSKTMRTQAAKDKFVKELEIFLNQKSKSKQFKGVSDPKRYNSKKWQDPHGMGKVTYSSGGNKSLQLAPAEIRIENLENLKRIINNAPPQIKTEYAPIQQRLIKVIDKEIEAETVRARKQELKLTRSGEKRGTKAISNLHDILEKMRNILINDIISYTQIIIAIIISLFYFTVGIVVFYISYHGAKIRGTLINVGE